MNLDEYVVTIKREFDASEKPIETKDLRSYCLEDVLGFIKKKVDPILEKINSPGSPPSVILINSTSFRFQQAQKKQEFSDLERLRIDYPDQEHPERKPSLFKKEDENIFILRTPPGYGHLMIYAISLKLRQPDLAVIALDVLRLYSNLEGFRSGYDLDGDHELTRSVKGAIVILGTSECDEDALSGFVDSLKKQNDFYEVDIKPKNPGCWGCTLLDNKRGTRICFFVWKDSFLGEPSERLTELLLTSGAVEIIHFACKVGSISLADGVFDIVVPRKFNVGGKNGMNEIKIENSVQYFRKGLVHVSFSHPFEELDPRLQQRDVSTVDLEGGFMARAVEHFPSPIEKPKPSFGAIYWVSDRVNLQELRELKTEVASSPELEKTLSGKPNEGIKKLVRYHAYSLLHFHLLHRDLWSECHGYIQDFDFLRTPRSLLESFYTPRTRNWLIEHIVLEIEYSNDPVIFFVAPEKYGKSVVLAELIRRFSPLLFLDLLDDSSSVSSSPNVEIGAFHFFSPTATSIIQTLLSIGLQLSKLSNEFRTEFLLTLKRLENKFWQFQNLETMINLLILKPASKMTLRNDLTLVVILDSIESCPSCAQFVNCLVSLKPFFPERFKFLLSTNSQYYAKIPELSLIHCDGKEEKNTYQDCKILFDTYQISRDNNELEALKNFPQNLFGFNLVRTSIPDVKDAKHIFVKNNYEHFFRDFLNSSSLNAFFNDLGSLERPIPFSFAKQSDIAMNCELLEKFPSLLSDEFILPIPNFLKKFLEPTPTDLCSRVGEALKKKATEKDFLLPLNSEDFFVFGNLLSYFIQNRNDAGLFEWLMQLDRFFLLVYCSFLQHQRSRLVLELSTLADTLEDSNKLKLKHIVVFMVLKSGEEFEKWVKTLKEFIENSQPTASPTRSPPTGNPTQSPTLIVSPADSPIHSLTTSQKTTIAYIQKDMPSNQPICYVFEKIDVFLQFRNYFVVANSKQIHFLDLKLQNRGTTELPKIPHESIVRHILIDFEAKSLLIVTDKLSKQSLIFMYEMTEDGLYIKLTPKSMLPIPMPVFGAVKGSLYLVTPDLLVYSLQDEKLLEIQASIQFDLEIILPLGSLVIRKVQWVVNQSYEKFQEVWLHENKTRIREVDVRWKSSFFEGHVIDLANIKELEGFEDLLLSLDGKYLFFWGIQGAFVVDLGMKSVRKILERVCKITLLNNEEVIVSFKNNNLRRYKIEGLQPSSETVFSVGFPKMIHSTDDDFISVLHQLDENVDCLLGWDFSVWKCYPMAQPPPIPPKNELSSFKYFKPLDDAERAFHLENKALLNLDLYVWKKIEPFTQALSEGQIDKMILFGCPRGPCWEEAKSYLNQQTDCTMTSPLPLKIRKSQRKPDLFEAKSSSNEHCFILRTPLGNGHIRLYLDCLKFFQDEECVNKLLSRTEEELSQESKLLIQRLQSRLKNSDFKCFTTTFYQVSDEKATIESNLQAFEQAYLDDDSKQLLKEAIQDALVFLGPPADQELNPFLAEMQAQYELVSPRNTMWKALVFRNLEEKKYVFFEWCDSFLGEISEMIGYFLLSNGAKELVHFACKAAVLTDAETVRKDLFLPLKFQIFEENSTVPNQVELSNSIFRCGSRRDESYLHTSVPNPFFETFDRISQFLRKGTTTIDDEGGFLARAAWKYNLHHPTSQKRFGAAYFASDIVLPKKEREWLARLQFEKDEDVNSLSLVSSFENRENIVRQFNHIAKEILNRQYNFEDDFLGDGRPGKNLFPLFGRESLQHKTPRIDGSDSSPGRPPPNNYSGIALLNYNPSKIQETDRKKWEFNVLLGDLFRILNQEREPKKQITVFISYAWDVSQTELENLQGFLKRLSFDLRALGIQVYWDKEDNNGHMRDWTKERIEQSTHIIVIGTPRYKERALTPGTNVHFEFHDNILRLLKDKKQLPMLVPIHFAGEFSVSFPPEVLNHSVRDFRDLSKYHQHMLGMDPIGLIPGIVESFRLDGKHRVVYSKSVELFNRSVKSDPKHISSQLPNSVEPFFIGRRQEMEQISNALKDQAQQTFVIQGPGGTGKSQVACEFAHRSNQEYALIRWLKADSEDSIRSSFLGLARDLEIETGNAELDKILRRVHQESLKFRHVLLIYDNAEKTDDIRPYLLTAGGSCRVHILITTRSKSIANELNVQSVQVKEFDVNEVKEYVEKKLRVSNKPLPLLQEFGTELDFLPFTICYAVGEMLTDSEIDTIEKFLSEFRKNKIAELPAISTLWKMSLSKLSPSAISILRLCSYLDPDQIPREILKSILGNDSRTVMRELEIQYFLNQLEDKSILKMHRLLQVAIRQQISDPILEVKPMLKPMFGKLLRAFAEIAKTHKQGYDYQFWRENFAVGSQLSHLAVSFDPQLLDENLQAFIFRWAAEFQGKSLLQYERAIQLLYRVVEIDRAIKSDHLATDLNNLAVWLKAKGDYDGAKPFVEEAISIWRNNLGNEHPQVATGLNNLAQVLEAKGDYDGAKPLMEQALAISRKALGDEHVATELSNLAGLLQAKGDYEGAKPLMEEALAISRKVLGDEHPDVALGLNNLAQLLQEKGDYAGAKPLMEQALSISRKVLGNEHPNVAAVLNNLAGLLSKKGDYDGAEPPYREALRIDTKALGDEHPGVATDLNNLAGLLRAEPLYREAVSIWKKSLGKDHPQVATGLNNLAKLLRDIGSKDEAQELGHEAYRVSLKALGPDHPQTKSHQYWETL